MSKAKDYPEIACVETLQRKLSQKSQCSKEIQGLVEKVRDGNLLKDFMEFEKECETKSEMCKYFGIWLKMAAVVKNMVASNREGNWELHVATVQDSLPIFAELDCVNYLRYGSWYYEQIKFLELTHPKLYRRFSMGQWVVQDQPGQFCAVGCDMKVEQTIQRVSKGPGGHFVVGATRNAGTVAEFELLYHEIGSITDLLDQLTTNNLMIHTECHLQHAMSTSRRTVFNENVQKLLDFVQARENPY